MTERCMVHGWPQPCPRCAAEAARPQSQPAKLLFEVPDDECGRAFKEAMQELHCPLNAQRDAWAWFVQGWNSMARHAERVIKGEVR